ncbi:hypothetical protein [Bradyrhizobium canariense]|uniref:hypothetical protein n=1 Tax=Bradyrhizobium canariense TaxID=255045 RepID=UPI001FDA1DB6|nr:hypothetical protein [Bradyrhizobium canariense]
MLARLRFKHRDDRAKRAANQKSWTESERSIPYELLHRSVTVGLLGFSVGAFKGAVEQPPQRPSVSDGAGLSDQIVVGARPLVRVAMRKQRTFDVHERGQCEMPMMKAEQSARTQAYQNNIQRYRRLLRTRLTEFERTFIEKRLSEELSELARLASAVSNEVETRR